MKKKKLLTIVTWFLMAFSVIGGGLGIYSYVSMPSQIANYVSQHKSELKGDTGAKGEQGQQGARGPMGTTGASGASSSSTPFSCSSYGTNNQFTSCY